MKSYINTLALPLLAAAFVATTGCQTFTGSGSAGDGDRTAGQMLDDKVATGNVEKALKNEPTYKFDKVQVTTYRGVVQLSGWATSEQQRSIAGQIARNQPGVVDVVNNISIKDTNREDVRQTPETRSAPETRPAPQR